ncbi:MAG TPA: hypothetical protein VHY75_10255 [Steroidobacteraceae bacterium]|nr:hypothetical protein [Steroidobacteraceae bacterium]
MEKPGHWRGRASLLFPRFLGVLPAAVLALFLPAAQAAPESAAIVVKGECRSTNKSNACNECEVTFSEQRGVAAAGDSLTGACPMMAAGEYELSMEIPVKLIPATKLDAKTFFQASASFGAQAHPRNGKTQVLLRTDALSWSWWSKDGMIIDKTDRIRVARDAAVEVAFRLADARYYVPGRSEGTARRDGELLIDKGAVMHLKAAHAI